MKKIRIEHLILAGGIALLIGGALLFGPKPRGLGRDPGDKKQGSSHYTTPSGGKAYYMLLKELGFSVRRYERKVELLPREVTMVVLFATSDPVGEEEVSTLRTWVEKGGTILWCPRRGEGGDDLLSAFGLETGSGGSAGSVSAQLEGAPAYTLSISTSRRLSGPGRLLAGDAGGGVVVEVPRGKGRFIALADPRMGGNSGLDKGDNAAFLVHLAQRGSHGGAIAFDEYHHGFKGGQEAFSILWDSPLGKSVLFLGLAAFCGVFAGARRLGPPLDLHEERRRRPAEFVEAFATLCRKMGAGSEALAMVLAEFKLFLQKRCGSSDPEIADRHAARSGIPAGTLKRALERARKMSASRRADTVALVESARELESLRRAMERRTR